MHEIPVHSYIKYKTEMFKIDHKLDNNCLPEVKVMMTNNMYFNLIC